MSDNRKLAAIWAFVGVGAVLAGVLALVSKSDARHAEAVARAEKTHAVVVEQQAREGAAAQKVTNERTAANQRIAELRFRCIQRYICQLAVAGEASLPLYIEGIDESFVEYLSQHGYSDHWSDNAHTISARSIAPTQDGETDPNNVNRQHGEEEGAFTYVAKAVPPPGTDCPTYDVCNSGLMYANTSNLNPSAMRPPPREQPGTFPWTVYWQLKNSRGQVVRELHFTITVANCEQSSREEDSPCGHSLDASRYEEGTHYPEPPLFPYN